MCVQAGTTGFTTVIGCRCTLTSNAARAITARFTSSPIRNCRGSWRLRLAMSMRLRLRQHGRQQKQGKAGRSVLWRAAGLLAAGANATCNHMMMLCPVTGPACMARELETFTRTDRASAKILYEAHSRNQLFRSSLLK